jgi:hypothetical protein
VVSMPSVSGGGSQPSAGWSTRPASRCFYALCFGRRFSVAKRNSAGMPRASFLCPLFWAEVLRSGTQYIAGYMDGEFLCPLFRAEVLRCTTNGAWSCPTWFLCPLFRAEVLRRVGRPHPMEADMVSMPSVSGGGSQDGPSTRPARSGGRFYALCFGRRFSALEPDDLVTPAQAFLCPLFRAEVLSRGTASSSRARSRFLCPLFRAEVLRARRFGRV